jgi:glycosyltransferase involved in cell wall biosynthesis
MDEYDVVHSHNEPDWLTVGALKKKKRRTPVIHDSHELLSFRWALPQEELKLERLANEEADGRIYVSQYQLNAAKELYKIDEEKSIVFPSYVLKDMIPKKRKQKLSEKDNSFHIVYEGRVTTGEDHRNFLGIFKELAENEMHIHIYPVIESLDYKVLSEKNPYIHYHSPKEPKRLIYEMTQYDCGIMPFNVNPKNYRHLQSVLAHKLFDYLAAGLPILSRDFYSLREFIEREKVGVIFNEVKDILRWRKVLKNIKITPEKYVMENYINEVVALYKKCIFVYS